MKWFPDDCQTGDMLRIPVGSFYHYGIYVSDDEVIEFGDAPLGGFGRDESAIRVIAVTVDAFSHGIIPEKAHLDAAERKKAYSPAEIAARARARLGEGGYSLLHNNCEHFVNSCTFGESTCSVADAVREEWMKRLGTKG